MSRIRKLRESQRRTSSLYDTWFTRRVSVFVTALVLPLGVTPNAVSAVNLMVGLLAWILIGTGANVVLGVALIHLYAVLDSVDGELARHTGRSSLQGMFLEDYSAYLMIAGYWLSMGVVLQRAFETPLPLVLAIALVSIGRSAMPVARRVLLTALRDPRWKRRLDDRTTPRSTAPRELSGPVAFITNSVLHPSHVWAVTTTVLLVEWILGTDFHALAVVVGGYYLLSWAKELAIVWRMGRAPTLELELAGLFDQGIDPGPGPTGMNQRGPEE